MLTAVKHNLTRLTVFKGRETRGQFWPWAGAVLGSAFVVWFATVALMISGAVAKVQAFAAAHPEQAQVITVGGSTSIEIKGDHPELTPDFSMGGWIMGAIGLVVVVLIAAAVSRRLHDCGRSAFWALAPLPFLAFGLNAFQVMMHQVNAGSGEPDMLLFAAIGLNNLVYLGVLLTLIIQLSGAGAREANRFGPPVG